MPANEVRYRAQYTIDGDDKLYRIFPPRGKRTTFASLKAAESAIDRASRKLTVNGHGRIIDTDGNLVLTIAM